VAYDYPPVILDALADLGICPKLTTRPELIHEFVNDLYRYELRCLRVRRQRGEIPRHDYSPAVIELRRKYMLVSIPVERWTKTISTVR